MSELQKSNSTKGTGNEIDILEMLKKLWKGRKYIFMGVAISIVLGLAFAFSSAKQYKVVTTMLPQSEEGGGMSGISSLAAIAGFDINLSDNGAEISPTIYPQIFESEPFLLNLMHTKYSFKKVKHPVSLFEYITKIEKPTLGQTILNYTVGLPAVIKETLKGKSAPKGPVVNDGLTRMNEDEDAIAKMLKNNVTLAINKKEGYLTLTSIFGEALLTAQVAKHAQDLLQETITAQKTKRALDQLEFFEKRYNEKKREYEVAQSRLAGYKDRNLFVTSATGSSEQERLQNDYNLTFSVYSELAKQLENAKIKVKRVTPVYLILKPVVVPLEPFAPRKTMILLVFIILGFVGGCATILAKEYLKILRKKKEQAV